MLDNVALALNCVALVSQCSVVLTKIEWTLKRRTVGLSWIVEVNWCQITWTICPFERHLPTQDSHRAIDNPEVLYCVGRALVVGVVNVGC